MTTQSRPTRRRGADLTHAIHETVSQELTENGFDGVTFERISQRGSFSKTTLYSRYRSPAHLVAETLSGRVPHREDFETSGSLETDLLTIFSAALRSIDRIGVEVFRKLIGSSDVAILSYITEQSPMGHQALFDAVSAAQARAELGDTLIPADAVRAPIEVLHSRVLLTDSWDGLANSIVKNVALPLYTALSHA